MAQFESLISANKRNSVILVILFVLFICILGGVLGWALWGDPRAAIPSIAIALAVALVTGLVGYYSGPKAVLALSRARPIAKPDDPELYNVVEELGLASGLPMPELHVIETPAMNAFATGRDPEHAHIAVTRGLRERLSRDQLQGVLAHELSHVKNYDIRFMTLMAVLVGTIVMLAHIGMRAMWFGGGRRRRGSGGGGLQIIILILAIVLAIVAPILARLIQMAVSRQREFLADASAARMTRYPEGLASALEALESNAHEMPQANGANAHLFIHEPRMARRGGRKSHGRWWSSHPPIAERVERLRSIGNIGA